MGTAAHLSFLRAKKRSRMTEANTQQLQFQIQQLRLKNIWKELEFISVLVALIILVNGLLPQLLVQYVYAGQQLLEAPPVFELLPAVVFAIGTLMFVYVGIGNLRREMQARKLEQLLNGTAKNATTSPISASVNQLQAAMKSVESRTARTSTKTRKVAPAKRETQRVTKAKRGNGAARRKSSN